MLPRRRDCLVSFIFYVLNLLCVDMYTYFYFQQSYKRTTIYRRISSLQQVFCCKSDRHFSFTTANVIQSECNEKVKLLRSLHQKSRRDKLNLIFLEGHRQIIDAIKHGMEPSLALISQRALEAPRGNELDYLLHQACLKSKQKSRHSVEVQMIAESLCEGLSDTMSNQGVFAAFKKPHPTNLEHILETLPVTPFSVKLGKVVLLLDTISDPGNLGTLIRSGFGFGCDCIISIDGCDIWNPKVIRASMGSILQIPVAELSWSKEDTRIILANAVSSSHGKWLALIAELNQDSVNYDAVDCKEKNILVVIGSEVSYIYSID